MPPGTARPAGSSAGHSKGKGSQKTAYSNNKRKSIATDPALLQGSSDEDGEGPNDHEHENHVKGSPSTHASTSKNTIGKKSSSSSSAKVSNKTPSASAAVAASGSPRRSTRLSGEGLETHRSNSAVASLQTYTSKTQTSQQVRSTSPRRDAQTKLPNKRKAPPASPTSVIENTHPTPPETDSDTARRRQATSGHDAITSGKKSGIVQPKRLKSSSGDQSSKAGKPIIPPPPPSDESDDSDNFAFTRVDNAPPPSAPSTSKHIPLQSASQVPPSASAPQRASSSSQRSTRPATKKAAPQATSSTKLLASLKEVRQNGSKYAGPSIEPSQGSLSSIQQGAIVADRKGKRKADDSLETLPESSQDIASSQQSGAPKSKGSRNKTKKGRVAELSQQGTQDPHQAQPPDPGTPDRSESTHIPINTQETPAIQRNLAMRAGLASNVPPGTPGASRRSSSDMRGRRGSSIGNGLEALPHPSIPSDTFYRHIQADAPPAERFRTLVTWAAHRLKDSMERDTRTASTEIRAAASGVVDALIADLVDKRIDLSWQPIDSADEPPSKTLPPNPENEANRAKLEACKAWIKRLQDEDQARNTRINQYKVMTERITKLTSHIPPASAPTDPSDPSTATIPDILQPDWRMPLPHFKDKADILAYGRKMLQPKSVPVSTRRKSLAAEPEADPDVIDVDKEYPINIDELRHQASSLAQNTYRVGQFLRLADQFVTLHLQKSQAALAQINNGQSHVASGSGSKGDNGDSAEETTQALLASAGSQSTAIARRRKVDPMLLLRAISRADTAKKR